MQRRPRLHRPRQPEAGRRVSDVIEARQALSRIVCDLSKCSLDLADVSRKLAATEAEYRSFVDDFELGLLSRSEDEEGYRLPSASLRLKMAHKAMDPALLGRYMGLSESRDRLKQRISDLKHEADSQRSILSALKVEAEN